MQTTATSIQTDEANRVNRDSETTETDQRRLLLLEMILRNESERRLKSACQAL